MAMEWTEETIVRLRELWQQGLSTAEIGRQLAVTKNAVVGKAHRLGLQSRPSPIRRPPGPARAVEQKAPPAAAPAVVSAPAPVRVAAPVSTGGTAPASGAPVVEPCPVTVASPLVADIRPTPAPASSAPVSPVSVSQDPAVRESATRGTTASASTPAAPASPKSPSGTESAIAAGAAAPAASKPEPRAPLRAVTQSAPRRSGLTCCWPLGDPGTPGFHFCGGKPVPGKPYCAEHAQLAYVKLRDRRDNVA
jgi:GcrA cell cycle regulator